jgi:glycosyltransferase involved in cell wall biosynthesis
METNKTISVILPIKTARSADFEDFFDRCIKSIKNQGETVSELVIVYCDDSLLETQLNSYDFEGLNVKFDVWKDEPNFANQVNRGVEISTSEWVSLIEFDDEYSNIWFKNSQNYMDIYPEINAFLPIVVDVNDKGVFVGFTNEATFAANFTQELGYLTNDTLQVYQNFQIAGMVIKKDTFLEYGKFKSNIKLTFGYEFFLRMTHASVKFMTIPKIGYKHMNLREGSIFWNYKNGENRLSEDEAKFWIESAKKEYFYIAQRDIKYEPQEV